MNKFGDDKTPAVLVLELSRIHMETKEKVKDFNQWFLTLRNRIRANGLCHMLHVACSPFPKVEIIIW